MITFTNLQPENSLRMAYNNDVIRFFSTTLTNPSYADVSINNGTTIRLYPAPNSTFYCNLSPYVQAIINTENFQDTTQPDLILGSEDSFVYPAENGRFLTNSVSFIITQLGNTPATDATTLQLYWLAAAQQHSEFRPINADELLVLTSNVPGSTNNWYVKYWEGYPFDLCLYNSHKNVGLVNTSNLQQQDFMMKGVCSRLFFSDGRTDVTLEDFIPLNTGINPLKITRENDDNYYTLTIDKTTGCPGVYLKWINPFGGYSYWLFENTFAIDRMVKDMGELERDFNNLQSSFGRTTQIGRKSQDTVKVIAEQLTPEQRNIVQTLFDSPKVFLFTGTAYGRSGFKDWIEVAVKTSSVRIKNPRQELTNFAIDIDLPERYTLSL